MKFFRKMGIYLFGSISSAIVSFLFLPLYTSRFSVSDFGYYDISFTTISLLVSFVIMEIWTGLLRFIYDFEEKEHDKLISNVLIITIALLVPYSITYFLIADYFDFDFTLLFIILGVSLLFQNLYQYYLRAIGKTKFFVYSGVAITSIQVALNLILILIYEMGVESLIISQIISRILVLSYIELKIRFLRKLNFLYYDFILIKKIFKFSFPFAINAIAFWGMTNINRYFAISYLGEDANGYIAVATKFSMILSLLSSIYILAWQESAFTLGNKTNRSEFYSKMLNYMIFIGGVVTFLLMPFTLIVFPFMVDENYSFALTLIPIYYIASFSSLINGFFGQLFGAEKKTSILAYSTFIGAIVNVSSLFILLPQFGFVSIPIALFFGTISNVCIRFILIQKIAVVRTDFIQFFEVAILLASGLFISLSNYPINTKMLYYSVMIFVFIILNIRRIKAYVSDFVNSVS